MKRLKKLWFHSVSIACVAKAWYNLSPGASDLRWCLGTSILAWLWDNRFYFSRYYFHAREPLQLLQNVLHVFRLEVRGLLPPQCCYQVRLCKDQLLNGAGPSKKKTSSTEQDSTFSLPQHHLTRPCMACHTYVQAHIPSRLPYSVNATFLLRKVFWTCRHVIRL